ncbi:MAG: helix-turn-helix domain-containing protein [Thermoanaerobaculia bacterium]
MRNTMPRKSKLNVAPVDYGQDDTLGQRIARIRKLRGYTQVELAERVGIIQALVSDYERGKLRLSADMAVRFAHALEVTTDELLGVSELKAVGPKPSRKILRRMEKIDRLRPQQQAILLKTIDTFLRGATK